MKSTRESQRRSRPRHASRECWGLLAERCRRDSAESLGRFSLLFLPHKFPLEPAPFHLELWDQASRLDGTLLDVAEIPRMHGKTTVRSLALPLWAAVTGRKRFILLVSESASQARQYLRNLKDELERNALLREGYGDLGRATARVWQAREVELANGVVMVAMGRGQSCRGLLRSARPDLIIVDDAQKLAGVRSHLRREHDWDWLTQELLPAGADGQCDVLLNQTRLHRECLSAKGLRLAAEGIGSWTGRTYRAITGGVPLWPAKYTADRLAVIRATVGVTAWAREYLNDPREDTEALFREGWLRYEAPQGKLRWALFLDPAKGREQGDYTAVVEVAINADGKTIDGPNDERQVNPHYRIAWCTRASVVRETYLAGARRLAKWAAERAKAGNVLVGWEEDQLGAVTREVRAALREAGYRGPSRPVRHGENKEERIIGTLQPPVERGDLRFSPDLRGSLLLDQLLDTPTGEHDDGPDALEGAYKMSTAGRPGLVFA